MIACFLQGELCSRRFGPAIRGALAAAGDAEELVSRPDLTDERANLARREILAATRGYGEDRELFEHFPSRVRWVWARLAAHPGRPTSRPARVPRRAPPADRLRPGRIPGRGRLLGRHGTINGPVGSVTHIAGGVPCPDVQETRTCFRPGKGIQPAVTVDSLCAEVSPARRSGCSILRARTAGGQRLRCDEALYVRGLAGEGRGGRGLVEP